MPDLLRTRTAFLVLVLLLILSTGQALQGEDSDKVNRGMHKESDRRVDRYGGAGNAGSEDSMAQNGSNQEEGLLQLNGGFMGGQDGEGGDKGIRALEDYLVEAAENNPELRAKFYEYQAALERVPQVGSLPDPQLGFGFFIRPMEFPMGDQRADLSLMQMFPWFGTLSAREDEASRMARARFESFRDAKNRLFYEVRSAWYELYELEGEIGIMEKNLDLLRELEELSLMRFQSSSPGSGQGSSGSMPRGSRNSYGESDGSMAGQSSISARATGNAMAGGMDGMSGMGAGNSGSMTSGSSGGSMQGNMGNESSVNMRGGNMSGSMQGGMNRGGMSDVLRVRMEINEMENMLALLIDSRAPLKARFNRLLNRTASQPVEIPDSLGIRILTNEEQALLDEIVSGNPMIRMLEEEAGALEIRERIARLEGRPSLGAGLNYMIFSSPGNGMDPSMAGRNMVMPMVTMTIPIYREKYRAREREAVLTRQSVMSSREDLENELAVRLSDVLRNIADAERRWDLYLRQTDLAEKSMDILITEFSGGLVRFEEVLRLQEQLLNYRLEMVRAVADHNRHIARLDMLTASELPEVRE